MAIKPILFDTEMVRATLDGRKSCTRRIVKFSQNRFTEKIPNPQDVSFCGLQYEKAYFSEQPFYEFYVKQPYQPEDILYVRETVWRKIGFYLDVDGETKPSWYNEFRYVASDEKPETGWNYSWAKYPSIYMPKEAARIWLKVTDVRVERLQEITEDGAKAEGINEEWAMSWWVPTYYDPDSGGYPKYRDTFAFEVWNKTIKKSDLDQYGWVANPWVWVIEFERCEKPEGEVK